MRRAMWSGLAWVACLIGVLGMTPAVHADDNEAIRFLRDYLHPDYLHRDMPHFVTWLELDDAQREVVAMLLKEYRESFDAELAEITAQLNELNPETEGRRARREFAEMSEQMAMEMDRLEATRRRANTDDAEVVRRLQDMEERIKGLEVRLAAIEEAARTARREPPPELLEAMAGVTDSWAKIKTRLKVEFDTNLLALLAEHQAAPWDQLQRFLRRDHRLPFGEYSGEKTCLLPLIEDLELDDAQRHALAPLIEAYEIELDKALYAREMGELDVRARYVRAMATQDGEAMLKAVEDESALRVRVRDAHIRHLDLMVATLPEADGAALRAAFRAAAFPRIYGRSLLEAAFDRALELELDDEVVEAVLAERESFRARLTPANEEAMRLLIKYEPQRMIRQIRRQVGIEDETSERRMHDAEQRIDSRRSEIEKSGAAALERLLTPEQLASLSSLLRSDD